jgi:CheY-like chemotaxis protein
VLVVDDAQDILLALRTSLRGAGNEADTADTAQDALADDAMRPPTPSSSISCFRRAGTRK